MVAPCLLQTARDPERNSAAVLRDHLLLRVGLTGSVDPGGEPVCWLARVCPACGRLEEDRAALACSTCGTLLDR